MMKTDASGINGSQGLAEWLLRLTDAGLVATLCGAPLIMGGRHPVGRLVLVTLVALTTLVWLIRQYLVSAQRWRLSGGEWLLACGVALVALQVIPLPPTLLNQLSPAISERLPLWANAELGMQLGTWSTLSLFPSATRSGLAILIAYAMLFTVVVQRLEKLADLRRLLAWLAISVTVMAAVGLLQFVAGNGKFLWFYAHPSRDTWGAVKGMFINENHCAHFLALGIGPLIWWSQRKGAAPAEPRWSGQSRNLQGSALALLPLVALGLVGFAGLLTVSRGGIAALLIATSVCLAVLIKAKLLGRRSLVVLAIVSLVMGGALVIHGYRPLINELHEVRSGSVAELDESGSRLRLWSAVGAAIADYPLLGTGVGTHEEVYLTYFDKRSGDPEYPYAENGYLQVLEETGLAGGLLLLAGLALCAWWCVRALRTPNPEHFAITAAVVGGLSASLLHSAFDFVWYIPACMSLTVVLAAAACRLSQWSQSDQDDRQRGLLVPPIVWAAGSVIVGVIGVGLVVEQLPAARAARHWERYLAMSLASNKEHTRGLAAILGHMDASSPEQTAAMIEHLERVVQADPQDARAHLRLAEIALQHFANAQLTAANAMPLNQIRDAALASHFASREAQDAWLQRAIGDNVHLLYQALAHLRSAVQLCPLQGEAYSLLAELSFLDGHSAKEAYVRQAFIVRPHSPLVLFHTGNEIIRAANLDETLTRRGLAFWKKALPKDDSLRRVILSILIPHLAPHQIIDLWEPDADQLYELYTMYLEVNETADGAFTPHSQYVAQQLAVKLQQQAGGQQPEVAAAQWRRAAEMYRVLNDPRQSITCLQRAIEQQPHEFHLHYMLAQQLTEQGQFDQAIEQWQWCLYRQPGHADLRRQLAEAKRRQLDGRGRGTISAASSADSSHR